MFLMPGRMQLEGMGPDAVTLTRSLSESSIANNSRIKETILLEIEYGLERMLAIQKNGLDNDDVLTLSKINREAAVLRSKVGVYYPGTPDDCVFLIGSIGFHVLYNNPNDYCLYFGMNHLLI